MEHLSDETLSELLDGGAVAEAEEHLASCAACRGQLESLQNLRAELRALPELEAPPYLWAAIESRLAARPGAERRRSWPRPSALQVAATAAVFVVGLGVGSAFMSEGPSGQRVATVDQEPASLAEIMAEVKRQGAEYDAALRRLEAIARRTGTPLPAVTAERLAALDALVEATRTALASDPADPVLNSYLFAALDERQAVLRELEATQGQASTEVAWR